MKPFDKMNIITARLLILIILAIVFLIFLNGSSFLYNGVHEAFETPSSNKKEDDKYTYKKYLYKH
jgi:flagellar basal body-associated protein FliL